MGFVLAKLRRWIPISSSRKNEKVGTSNAQTYHGQQLAFFEQAERDDHEAALALQHGQPLPPPTEAQLKMETVSFPELLEKFIVADLAAQRPRPEVGSISQTMEKKPKRTLVRVDCVVCQDPFESMACLDGPCGHFICHQCVISMAEVASRDEGLFPLQCCRQPLPMDIFLSFLPDPLRMTLSSKCAEAATPDKARVYCPAEKCSNFIGRSLASTPSIMTCPTCGTAVCSGCKDHAHSGVSCQDNADNTVRALAKENGWKTCPKCGRIVERTEGCSHMICRCRQGFCYKCERTWRRCAC